MRNSLFIFLLSAAALWSNESVYSQSGGRAGAYLRVGVGARPLGMGGAFTAVANDAYATYWNPAGLVQLRSSQIGSMYAIMSLDRKYSFLSLAFPVSAFLSFGMSGIDFRIDQIEARDRAENLVGTFGDAENAFGFSLGIAPVKGFSIGGNFKYLLHKLVNQNAAGYGFDAAVLIRPSKFLSLGFLVQDLGSFLEWKTESGRREKFPLNARAGLALKLLDDRLLVSTDIVSTEDSEGHFKSRQWHGGVEIWPMGFFATRVGYNDQALTGGTSLKIPHMQVDYSFAADDIDASNIHRLSLLIDF